MCAWNQTQVLCWSSPHSWPLSHLSGPLLSIFISLYLCLYVFICMHVCWMWVYMCMYMTQMYIYKHLWVLPTYTCKSLYTCAGRSQKSVTVFFNCLPSLLRHGLLLNLDLAECFRDLPVFVFPSYQSGITGTHHYLQLFIQAKFLGKHNGTRNCSRWSGLEDQDHCLPDPTVVDATPRLQCGDSAKVLNNQLVL